MKLTKVKIQNFRCIHALNWKPNDGLSILVGENDSGKTAIVDAIKLVLGTKSYDYIRPNPEDFHVFRGPKSIRAPQFFITCRFSNFAISEAKNFIEWLTFDDQKKYELIVHFNAFLDENEKVTYEVRAGGGEGTYLDSNARDLIRATYLRPLRDAENELAPRKGSRISQVLSSHHAFASQDKHELVGAIKKANDEIEGFFKYDSDKKVNEQTDGAKIQNNINSNLGDFAGNNPLSSKFSIAGIKLRNILEKLSLKLIDNSFDINEWEVEPGLGSNNLLFIAVELLLLSEESDTGLKLALIEEIEAHLHPQAQLRLIESLQAPSDITDTDNQNQLIVTTHSPTLASKIKLEHLHICVKGNIFSMGSEHTKLEKGDYRFLERFLDSTKANLFFAKGVILVEGDAENLLLPTIALLIDRPLSRFGVSIVNVGSTALLRFARIFQRSNNSLSMGVPVAVVTDVDILPDIYKTKAVRDSEAAGKKTESDSNTEEHTKNIQSRYDGQDVKTFVSPKWTLEYVLAMSSLKWLFLDAVLRAEKEKNSNKYAVTDVKVKNINKEIQRLKLDWASKTSEEIAFCIYYDLLLGKNISKAICAQYFAELIAEEENKIMVLAELEDDKSLVKYIVDALNYATGDHDART